MGIFADAAKRLEEHWNDKVNHHHFYLRPYLDTDGRYCDLNNAMSDDLIFRILRMPKIGKRLSIGRAYTLMTERCFRPDDPTFLDLTPCAQDLVEWAKRHGYHIEPDPGELEFTNLAC